MIKSSLKRNSEKFVQRITGSANQSISNDSDRLSKRYSMNTNDDDDEEILDENECYSVNKQ